MLDRIAIGRCLINDRARTIRDLFCYVMRAIRDTGMHATPMRHLLEIQMTFGIIYKSTAQLACL